MRDTSQDNMIYYTLAAIRRLFQANKKKPATITKKRPGNSKKSQKNALSEAAYRKLFRKAEKASKAREWQQAAKLWQVVLDTQDLQATLKPYLKLSQALRKQGYTREAEDLMQKAAANFGELPAVTKEFAEIAMTRGDWEQAVKHWKKTLTQNSESVPHRVFIGLAQALLKLHEYDQAGQIIVQAESYFGPGHEKIAEIKASFYRQKAVWSTFKTIRDGQNAAAITDNWSEAQKHLDRFCEEFPDAAQIHRMNRFRMQARLCLLSTLSSNYADSSAYRLEEYLDNLTADHPEILDELKQFLVPRLSSTLLGQHSQDNQAMVFRNETTDYIATLDKDKFTFDSWLDLYTLLWYSGFIVSSGLARKKAVERLYADVATRSLDNTTAYYALLVSLDQGDLTHADYCLKTLDKIGRNDSQFAEIKAYNYLLHGNRNQADKFFQKRNTCSEKKFFDYIYNKKVAIVGNSVPSNLTDEELDYFDVIVRLDSPLG